MTGRADKNTAFQWVSWNTNAVEHLPLGVTDTSDTQIRRCFDSAVRYRLGRRTVMPIEAVPSEQRFGVLREDSACCRASTVPPVPSRPMNRIRWPVKTRHVLQPAG